MARDAAVEAVFAPVRAATTFEETVERLGTAIRVGLLPPGSRLPPERALAKELGISRSTLRQALTTLIQSGHLNSARGRSGGTFVADRPPLTEGDSDPLGRDARAILDRRVAVELGATVLASERSASTGYPALIDLVERMSGPASFEEYRRADIRFHIGVAEAAKSPHLVTEMTEVQGQMSELIARIPHPEEVLTRSNEQHRELIALSQRETDRAVALMRRHIEGTEHILAGLI